MKQSWNMGVMGSALLGLLLSAAPLPAQTNFWWTNQLGGAWDVNLNWTHEAGVGAPGAGGYSDYIINMGANGTFTTLNNLGAPNFLLNQLQFAVGAATIQGDAGINLALETSTWGVLPQIINSTTLGQVLNIGLQFNTNVAFMGAGTGSVLINSNITGVGGLLMGGNYTLILNNSNSYAGATLITNGVLKLGSTLAQSNNWWAFGTNRTLTISGSGTLDLNNTDVRSNYNVVISGAGFGGQGAIINSSTAGMQGGFTNVTLAGDAAVGGANHWDMRSFSGTGLLNLNGYTLTKVGAGTLNIVNDLVTPGNIVLSNGTLSIEGGSIVTGTVGNITINPGSTFYFYSTTGPNITRPIVANGGTLQLGSGGAGAGAANSPITLQTNTTFNASSAYVLNGVIAESGGSFALVKTGITNLTLTAANSYSGGTSNTAGLLVISNASALGTGPLVMAGGSLSNGLLGVVTVANPVVLNSAGTVYQRASNGSTLVLSGVISGAQGLTLWAGNTNTASSRSSILLSGTNTFTGNVSINNGMVIINNSQSLGTGTKTITINRNTNWDPQLVLDGSSGVITLASGLSFTTSQTTMPAISNAAGNNVINGNFTLAGGGGATRIVVGGGTLTLNGTFLPNTTVRTLDLGGVATGLVNGAVLDNATTNMGVTKADAGLWILAGTNTYSGKTVINGGTLQIGNGANTGSLGGNLYTNTVSIASGAKLAFNRLDTYTVSNNLFGAGQVLQNGGGGVLLVGTNTYTGGTVVNNGALGFVSALALPATAGGITINRGGAVMVSGPYTDVAGWLASGRIATNSAGALALTASSGEAIDFGVYSNLALGAAVGSYVTFGGTLAAVNNHYYLGGGGGTLAFLPALTSGSVTLTGPGTVYLLGNNALAGGLTINSGELGVAFDNGLGAAGSLISVAGGTLQANGTTFQNLGARSLDAANFNGSVNVINPFGVFVIATNLTGSGSLTKKGPGTLVLLSSNSYTGGTTVSNGTLRLLTGGGKNLLSPAGSLAVAGGVLDLAGNSQSLSNAPSFQGGVVQNGTLINESAADFDGRAGLVAANLQSAGALTKSTAGTLMLLGNNTHRTNNLNAGTLAVATDANLGGADSVLNFNGGTLQILGTALTTLDGRVLNLNAGAVLDINSAAHALTLNNALNLSNSLTKAGTGLLVLAGANTGGSPLIVTAGTLALTGDNSGFGSGYLVSGGALQLGNNGASGTLGAGNITNNAALVFSRSDNYGVTNNVFGTGATIIRNGALTYGVGGLTNNQFMVTDTAGQNATFNLTSGVVRVTSTAAGQFIVGAVGNGGGAGVFNMSGGLLTAGNELWIAGVSSNSRGLFNLSGGVVVVSNWTAVGRGGGAGFQGSYGEVNISGGSWSNLVNNSFTIASYGGNTGRVTVTGGNLYVQNNLWVGEGNGATVAAPSVGTLLLGGGLVNVGGYVAVGQNSAALGSFIQTGGVLNVVGEFDIGFSNALSYGFYQNTGGLATNGSWLQMGRGGLGLAYLTGGTNVMTSANGIVAGNNTGGNGTGVLYISGGTVRDAGAFRIGNAGSARGEVTIGNASVIVGANGVSFNQAGTTTGFLNLNSGGVLAASNIYKNAAGGLSVLNLNGGTLVPLASQTFMGPGAGGAGALDGAYLYANGVTVDISSNNVTISQNLMAPVGSGVTSIPFSGPVAGYMGAPYVSITGGGGTGATAVALFDFASGTVTGIVITSAGFGYTSTPVVSLLGGGVASNFVGLAGLGANASGALTKQGLGVLTLSGTNTYAGGTIISGGAVNFATAGSLSSTGLVTIGNGGALAVNGPFSTISGWLNSGYLATNGAYGSMALSSNSAEALDFGVLAGGVHSNLALGALAGCAVLYTGALAPNNGSYKLGGGGGTLMLTNDLMLSGGAGVNIGNAYGMPGTVWLGGVNTYSGGTVLYPNAALSMENPGNLGGGALAINGGTLQVRGTAMNDFGGLASVNINAAGDMTFDVAHPGNTFAVAANMLVGGAFTKLGAGTLALGGSNNIAGAVTISAGALRLTHGDALDGAGSNVLVVSGAALQLQGGLVTEVGDMLTLNGSGVAGDGALRNISGSNVWAGNVLLGSASRINADAGLLIMTGIVSNGGNALTVGGAGNTLIRGQVLGSGSLTKFGDGSLRLAGSNLYTGATVLNGGQLLVDFSEVGSPANNIINPASALTFNSGPAGTLVVVGSASGARTQTFNTVTANSGAIGSLTAVANGQPVWLIMGALPTNIGAVLDVSLPALGGIVASNQLMNGIIPTVTIGGQDFATTVGGVGTPLTNYSAYTLAVATGNILVSNNASNVKIDAAADATVYLTNMTIINSLVVNDPVAEHTLAMNGYQLKPSSGGPSVVMLAQGSSNLTIGSVVNDGSLAGNNWLYLINNARGGSITVNAPILNGSSYVTVGGPGNFTLNGTNVGTGNYYFTGPGNVTLNNTNSLTGAHVMRSGTVTFSETSSNSLGGVTVGGSGAAAALNINGITTLGGSTMTVGAQVNDRAVVTIASNTTMNKLFIGSGAGAAGAVVQNSGAVMVGSGVGGTDVLSMGLGGYGYYRLNGGTLLSGQFAPGGSTANSVGVFDQYGGATTVNGQWFIFGWGSTSRGVLNLYDGSISFVTNQAALTMGYNGVNSFGAINLLGGSAVLDATGGTNGLPVEMMRTGGNLANVLNLNGGTLVANQIKATSAGVSLLNFNGGTLLANTNTAFGNTFLQGLTAVTIYPGGATLDTTNNNITVALNLQAPTGFGVGGITLASTGAGYIGAPVVLITGGSGTGATAVAQVDLASGMVTNILMTSAGVGYLPTDNLNVQLLGGGYTNAAVPGTLTFAANSATGGLIKNGAGTLTLTGTNTYGGATVINNGLLVMNSLATNTLNNLGGAGALAQSGAGFTLVTGTTTLGGSTLISNGVLQFMAASAVPPTANSIRMVSNSATVFDFGGGAVNGALAKVDTASTGVLALTPNSAGENLDFNAAGLAGVTLGTLGTLNYTGTLTPYNSTYRLGGGGGTLTINQAINAGTVVIGNGTNAWGYGTVVLAGANTYDGPSFIKYGTLRATTANSFSPNSPVELGTATTSQLYAALGALPVLDLNGQNQSIPALSGGAVYYGFTNVLLGGGTLTLSGATNTTFNGSIAGTGGLKLDGGNRLTLTGNQNYRGLTTVNSGELILSNAQLNSAVMLANGGSLRTFGAGTNGLLGGYYTNINAAATFTNALAINQYVLSNAFLGSHLSSTNSVAGIFDFPAAANFPAPFNGASGTNFAVRWVGKFIAPTNGLYYFDINSDDGSLLALDGTNVVVKPTGGFNAVTNISNTIMLTAGLHDILIGLQNGIGGYGIYVDMGLPGGVPGRLGNQYLLGNGPVIGDLSGVSGSALVISNGSLAVGQTSDQTFSGNLSGLSGVVFEKGGPATLTLAGTNTAFLGTTLLNWGGLIYASSNALPGNVAGSIQINTNAAVAFDYTVANGLQSSLGYVNGGASGIVAVTAASAGENLNFAAAGLTNIYLGALSNVTYTGAFTPYGGVYRLGAVGGSVFTYGPSIPSGSVAIGGGAGTVVLSSVANSFTGVVVNSGTLRVMADNTLGAVVAGTTNLTLGGGTLQAGVDGITLGGQRNILLLPGTTNFIDDAGYQFTLTGGIIGTGLLTKVGSGTLTLRSNTNTFYGSANFSAGQTVVTNALVNINSNGVLSVGRSNDWAQLNLRGTSAVVGIYSNSQMHVGYSGTGVLVVADSASLSSRMYVGNNSNSVGAVYQRGGAVTITGGSGNDAGIGYNKGSYGYYELAGGVLTNFAWFGVSYGGLGVLAQQGGLMTVNGNGSLAIGRNGGTGVVFLANGSLLSTRPFDLGNSGGATSVGVLTIGPGFTAVISNTVVMGSAAGQTEMVNLNGGTLLANQFTNAAANSYLNLNGGTLKAGASSTAYLQSLSAAYIYGNGVTLDTSNNNITINQPLLVPNGLGVTNISLGAPITGYLGSPYVALLGGGGVGASAYALFDSAQGAVTGIVVTSYGSGYTTAPTVTLIGGGLSNVATGTAQLGALATNGSLIKTGSGTLTLGGFNTVGGGVVVSNGNLQVGSGGTNGWVTGSVAMVNPSSWLGFSHSDTITNTLSLGAPNGPLVALVQNGVGTLVLTNTNLSLFGGLIASNGTVLFPSTAVIPTNSTGRNSIALANGGGVVVAGAYTTVGGWLASGLITNNGGVGVVALPSGSSSENINWTGVNGVYSNLYLGVAPGQTFTYTGTLTPASTNYLVGGGGGTLVIPNPNTFTDNGYASRGLVVGVGGSSNSVVQVLGPQSYAGGTIITNALLSVMADNNLGYGAVTVLAGGTLQITNAPNFTTIRPLVFNLAGSSSNVLDIATGSTATLYGAVSAPNSGNNWVKWGGGTLVFSSNLVVIGGTSGRWALEQGLTIVDTNAVVNSAAAFTIVGYNNGDNATLLVRGNGQITTTGGGNNSFILGDQSGSTGVLTLQDNAQVYVNNGMYIAGGGTGALNLNNGSLTVSNLTIGSGTGGNGTLNLNGGVLTVRGATGIYTLGGTSTFNFNGGTLRAGANVYFSNAVNNAVILAGGAYLDASNYTLTINKQLSGSGNLVVSNSGSGVVLLNGTNINTGNTYANVGILRLDTPNSIGPGGPLNGVTNRNLLAGLGGTVAIGGSFTNVDYLLSRLTNASRGTVAWSTSMSSNVNLAANLLTNVSFGAVYGASVTNLGGLITPVNQTYRLGGGGGTLVLTNDLLLGTNLVAFGSGSGGTLVLFGTNTWSQSLINGGVVQYATTNAMGADVNVNFGGSIASTGALSDVTLLAQVNPASQGTLALVVSNVVPIDLTAFAGLSIGAYGGSVTNYAGLTPYGTTYRLGGGGGTLVLTNENMLTGGGNNLVLFGAGSAGGVILMTNNDFAGGTYIGALGTATVNVASLGVGAVTNDGLLVFNPQSGNTGNVVNVISGAGQVQVVTGGGSGAVNFVAANTYTGLTVVGGNATLILSNGTGAALQGSLQLGNSGNQSYLVMGAGNQFGSNSVVTIGASGGAFGRFILNGTTQTIAGLSSATGNGMVENTDAAQGANTGPALLVISNGLGASYTYNGGFFRNAFTAGASNYLALTKDGLGTQVFATYTNVIGSAFTGLTTVANGSLVFSNTPTWSSPLLITGGQLVLASAGATTVNRTVITNTVNNGLGFTGGNAFTIGGLAGNGGVSLWSQTGGGVALTIGSNNLSSIYTGILSDAGPGNYYQGSLNKIGLGLLTLSGANTYRGGTTNNAGGIALGADNVLGYGPVNMNGGALSSDGTTARVLTNAISITTASTLGDPAKTGLLTLTGPVDLTGAARGITNQSDVLMTGSITNGGVNKSGAGTMTWQGNAIYLSAASEVRGGTLVVDGASVDSTSGLRPVVATAGGTARVLLTNSASLWVHGVASQIRVGMDGAIGTNIYDIAAYATSTNGPNGLVLRKDGSVNMVNLLPGGVLTVNGISTDGAGANNTRFNFNGGLLRAVTNDAAFMGTGIGTVNVLAGGAWVDDGGNAITVAASLQGTLGDGGLTKLGAGTLTLSGTSTYNGATVISNGTLKIGANNALPGTTRLYADTFGVLDLAGWNQQSGGIDGYRGMITDSIGNGRLTVNFGGPQTNTFFGALAGPGHFSLTGGGVLQLAGTNSFSGGTLVSNASYYVNGLHNGGMITAFSNALVGGTGPISALYVDRGGVFAPGNGLATQLVATLTLTNAGLLELELSNHASDKVVVTNSLLVADGAQLKLQLASYAFVSGVTITLLDWSAATGFDPVNPAQWFTLNDAGLNNGLVWTNGATFAVDGGTGSNNFFQINYNDLANGGHAISLTAVPEAGTASLFALIGAAWLVQRFYRRRRQV